MPDSLSILASKDTNTIQSSAILILSVVNSVVEDVREGISRPRETPPSPEEEEFLLVFFDQVCKLFVLRKNVTKL